MRPALLAVFERNDLQNARMIERAADFFFALKARKSRRVALELGSGTSGDRLSSLEVGGFEHRAHGAAIDHAGDLEAFVEELPG